MGASTTGKFTDGYYFVEERIKSNHANELFAFCKWIDAYIGGAARGIQEPHQYRTSVSRRAGGRTNQILQISIT